MVLEETMNKLLRDVVNIILLSSGFAIKAKQNAPRPSGPYATVEFVSDTGVGWEEKKKTDETLPSTKILYEYAGVREIMFSLNFLKSGAIDNARKVRTGLIRESISDLFWVANLGIGQRSQVREIPNVLDTEWEDKAQFDLTINAVGTDSELIESIGSLDIAGEFQERGLEYNFNILIGV